MGDLTYLPSPLEAALQAENQQLKARLKWCQAALGLDILPGDYGLERNIGTILHGRSVTIPLSGGVRGVLDAGGTYQITARSGGGPEDFEVRHGVAGSDLPYLAKFNLLTKLHEQFLAALAEKLRVRS